MATLPTDYSLIGIVLAISLSIILLSGLGLYVAFRVKETLREERGRGAKAAKVGLLIGLLFLSGGVFFFFASGINSFSGSNGVSTSTTVTSSSFASTTSSTLHSSSSLTTSSTLTTTSGSLTSSSSTSVTTTIVTTTVVSSTSSSSTTSSLTSQGSLSMTASFPSSETAGSTFYGSFTIFNNGSTTASSVTIQVGNLFNQFAFQNCTLSVNGGTFQNCNNLVSGSGISLGNTPPGNTIITLGLKSPSQPGQFSDTATLYYFLGSNRNFVITITIHVTA